MFWCPSLEWFKFFATSTSWYLEVPSLVRWMTKRKEAKKRKKRKKRTSL